MTISPSFRDLRLQVVYEQFDPPKSTMIADVRNDDFVDCIWRFSRLCADRWNSS